MNQIIGEDAINKTFARTIPGILETKAGIFGGLYRGSSVVQTEYILDNMSLNNGLYSENYTGINTSTIQEISVQTGGYNAGVMEMPVLQLSMLLQKGMCFFQDEKAPAFSNIHGTVLDKD